MTMYGTDERRNERILEESRGDWEEGVYIPAHQPGGRTNRGSLIHDLVRTLLELRGQ